MRLLFNAAMRWELIPYQHNPMSLVRVKDGSKRKKEPKALSADEFRRLVEHIPEPFRTMCIVAMSLGLRVSELLGLKWGAIDWEGSRIAIRQSYVYGQAGDVKTPGSQRWMPLDHSLADILRQHQQRSRSAQNTEDWYSPTPKQESRFGPAAFRSTGSSPPQRKRGWAGSAGTHFGTAIPRYYTRSVSISTCNRNCCGMPIFAPP